MKGPWKKKQTNKTTTTTLKTKTKTVAPPPPIATNKKQSIPSSSSSKTTRTPPSSKKPTNTKNKNNIDVDSFNLSQIKGTSDVSIAERDKRFNLLWDDIDSEGKLCVDTHRRQEEEQEEQEEKIVMVTTRQQQQQQQQQPKQKQQQRPQPDVSNGDKKMRSDVISHKNDNVDNNIGNTSDDVNNVNISSSFDEDENFHEQYRQLLLDNDDAPFQEEEEEITTTTVTTTTPSNIIMIDDSHITSSSTTNDYINDNNNNNSLVGAFPTSSSPSPPPQQQHDHNSIPSLSSSSLEGGYISSTTSSSTTTHSHKSSTSSSRRHHHSHHPPSSSSKNNRSAPVDVDSGHFISPHKHAEKIHALGIRYLHEKQYHDALDVFNEIIQSITEEGSPILGSAYHNRGIIHTKLLSSSPSSSSSSSHHHSLALQSFQSSIHHHTLTLSRHHPIIATSLVKIGFLHLESSSFLNALHAFRAALDIRRAAFGSVHAGVAKVYNNLGVVYLSMGDGRRGKGCMEKALEIQRHLLAEMYHKEQKGEMKSRRRRRDDGMSSSSSSSSSSRNSWEEEKMKCRLEIADSLCNLGSCVLDYGDTMLMGVDDRVEAEAALAEALTIRVSILGNDHPSIQSTREKFEQLRHDDLFCTMIDSPHRGTIINSHITTSNKINNNMATTGHQNSSIDKLTKRNLAMNEKRLARTTQQLIPPTTLTPLLETTNQQQQPQSSSQTSSTQRIKNPKIPMSVSLSSAATSTQQQLISRDPSSRSHLTSSSELSFSSSSNNEDDDVDLLSLHNQISIITPSAHSSFPHFKKQDSSLDCGEGDSLTNIGSIKQMKHKSHVVFVRLLESDDGICNNIYEEDENDDDERWNGGEEDINFLLTRVGTDGVMVTKAAMAFLRRNEHSPSLILFHALLQSHRSTYGELHPLVGTTWHNIGIVHLQEGSRLEMALSSFQKAVRLRKGALGEDHPDVAVSLVKVGITLLLLYQHDTSLLTFQQALSVRKNSLGHLHPALARVYNNIGCVHVHANDLRLARRSFESALDVQRGLMSDFSSSSTSSGSNDNNKKVEEIRLEAAMTLINLGLLYRYRKMFRRSLIFFDEALRWQEESSLLGTCHETTLSTLDIVADTTSRDGNVGEGLRLYKVLLSRLQQRRKTKKGGGPGLSSEEAQRQRLTTTGEALVLYKMGRLNAKMKDWESARERLGKSLELLDEEMLRDGMTEKMTVLRTKVLRDIGMVDEELRKGEVTEWV